MNYAQMKNTLISAKTFGLTMILILFVASGMTTQVHAQGKAIGDQVDLTLQMQASPSIILVNFSDSSPIPYTDLSGNPIGEGVFVGELRCVADTCNQKIEFHPRLSTGSVIYEYKFKTLQAIDLEAERVVVSGTGTISNGGPKMKFLFTGIFDNNGDGTIRVTYQASRPDASFIFPAVPGTFITLNYN